MKSIRTHRIVNHFITISETDSFAKPRDIGKMSLIYRKYVNSLWYKSLSRSVNKGTGRQTGVKQNRHQNGGGKVVCYFVDECTSYVQ